MIRAVMQAMALAAITVAPVAAQEATSEGSGAVLRGLDKLTGRSADIELRTGETGQFGRIEVSLGDCRFPEGNPAGDAFAFLSIRETGKPDLAFRGWMIASSPALNAMDNQRYDVWVLRCTNS